MGALLYLSSLSPKSRLLSPKTSSMGPWPPKTLLRKLRRSTPDISLEDPVEMATSLKGRSMEWKRKVRKGRNNGRRQPDDDTFIQTTRLAAKGVLLDRLNLKPLKASNSAM